MAFCIGLWSVKSQEGWHGAAVVVFSDGTEAVLVDGAVFHSSTSNSTLGLLHQIHGVAEVLHFVPIFKHKDIPCYRAIQPA